MTDNWFFKFFTLIHVALYRLTGGKMGGSMNGADVLLLTTTGRKSGQTRTTPLMYIQEGDNFAITASAGGADKSPGWYWNAVKGSHPVQIQVKDQVMAVDVTEAKGDQRDQLYQRFIAMMDQFATYEEKTERKIPVLVLKPSA